MLNAKSFGFIVHEPLPGDSPQVPLHASLGYRSVRLSNAGIKWWQVETSDGVFDFTRFDAIVSVFEGAGIRPYYEFGLVPDFHTDDPSENHNGYHAGVPNDWSALTRYVAAVVDRYQGRLDYGLGNEPDHSNFWAGTEEQYHAFCTTAVAAIRASYPSAFIISPSVTSGGTGWLDRWFDEGGGDLCDAVGYHPYVQPGQPEEMVQLTRHFRAIMRKHGLADYPLYATEITWHQYRDEGDLVNSQWTTDPGDTPMPDALAAAYIARELIALFIAKADGVYHFGLDDFTFNMVHLVDANDVSSVEPAGTAFGHVASTLTGAVLSRFRQVPPLYTVDWSKSGERGRILWCDDDETATVDLTEFSSGADVLGDAITLSASYEVTHSPVFVTR